MHVEWGDVHLEPVGDAARGYIHIRFGKTRNAKRNISLTVRACALLLSRKAESLSKYVFHRPDRIGALSRSTVDHQHARVRTSMKGSKDFVIHSFRHTMLTRLGEAGVDAFTIMKIAGHSSIAVSQRYVHPTPETLERAIDQLENGNTAREAKLKRQLPATVSATDGLAQSAVIN